MTTPTTTQRQDSSLIRDLLYAARYYPWRPRVLLTLATIAIVAGLALNWSWLVAAGLAPILISTLPCLVMCAFGVCTMCRSGGEHSASARDATDLASPPATLAISATDKPSTSTAGCCQGATNEAKPEQTIDLQSIRERKDSHA